MPTFTHLGALKTIAHKLDLYEFPECEDSRAVEACLYLRARIQELRRDAEYHASLSQETLCQCFHEFEFTELVLARLRTFIDLARPLEPMETISAMSAMQFLTRRLATPFTEWNLRETDLPELDELLVELQ